MTLTTLLTPPRRIHGRGRQRLQETGAILQRLLLQLKRRPSSVVVGLVQPLIWLVLFAGLFANAPAGFLPANMGYGRFMAAGLIVFTTFSGALNAGLPLMFDREFGFLNRILAAPLRSRSSVVLASVAYIALLSLVQSLLIMLVAGVLGFGWPALAAMPMVLAALLLLTLAMTSLSLGLAFALPGHIELLAITFVINLPLLFASTALAPLSFMPTPLRWLACLNPLTYAIEPIRAAYRPDVTLATPLLEAPFGSITAPGCLLILAVLAALLLWMIQPLLNRRLAD
jgi:ABC-2 type transport system permease protein